MRWTSKTTIVTWSETSCDEETSSYFCPSDRSLYSDVVVRRPRRLFSRGSGPTHTRTHTVNATRISRSQNKKGPLTFSIKGRVNRDKKGIRGDQTENRDGEDGFGETSSGTSYRGNGSGPVSLDETLSMWSTYSKDYLVLESPPSYGWTDYDTLPKDVSTLETPVSGPTPNTPTLLSETRQKTTLVSRRPGRSRTSKLLTSVLSKDPSRLGTRELRGDRRIDVHQPFHGRLESRWEWFKSSLSETFRERYDSRSLPFP